jgi:hypothetical protein
VRGFHGEVESSTYSTIVMTQTPQIKVETPKTMCMTYQRAVRYVLSKRQSRPTSSSRETTDKVSPRRLSNQVSNVEDRGGRAELLTVEAHGLLHSENLGVIQSGFATSTVGLSKWRFSSTRARMYGLLKVLQSPIDAKRWSIPRSGKEQLLPRNSLGHQEKRQDEPIDPPENSLVLSGSLAERARTDRARQSTMTSFHINGRLITTHDLRHLFTPLILGDTDISAGILVHLRDGVGDFESLPVIIVSLLSIDSSDVRLGDVGLLTIKLRLSAGHLGRGATVRIRQSCSRPAEQDCCWTFDRHSVSED